MMLEAVLRTHLISNPTVADLVSNRVYPMVLPQNPTFPAITYQRVSRTPVRELSGTSHTVSRMQYSCWARSYGEAKQVALAVLNAFATYSGTSGDLTVLGAEVANETDLYDSTAQIYHCPVDILVKYQGGDSNG